MMTPLEAPAKQVKKRDEQKSEESEFEFIQKELENLNDKITSRKFYNFSEKYRRDYCRTYHQKLKAKINQVRADDFNWVAHSKFYNYCDNVLENLAELFDVSLPEYDKEFYREIIDKYWYRGDEKINKIEKVFRQSDNNQKKLTLSTLEKMAEDAKKTADEIVEKNPEVVAYYKDTCNSLDKRWQPVVEAIKHEPVIAMRCTKRYLGNLECTQEKLKQEYKDTTGIRGLWNRTKEKTRGFFERWL